MIVLAIILGIAENLDKIVAIVGGGTGTAIITALIAYFKGRKLRKNALSLEESVRKELWGEIGNLRNALRELNNTFLDWQSKYIELLHSHQKLAESLVQSQKNFTKVVGLMNEALNALDKIEEIERNITAPDLEVAKEEIAAIKKETGNIREKAAILYNL